MSEPEAGNYGGKEVRVEVDIAHYAATYIVEVLQEVLAVRPHASLVVAGGSTFRPVYQLLADSPIEWERVELFFGDERCLPPDHPDSNYHMLQESWLSRAKHLPQVHRLRGEKEPAQEAERYAQELTMPFDLVLLGIGPDGHTASLFSTDILAGPLVIPSRPSQPPLVERLTLTPAALNASQTRLVVATGGAKAEVVAKILKGEGEYPVSLIKDPLWLLDPAAASLLK